MAPNQQPLGAKRAEYVHGMRRDRFSAAIMLLFAATSAGNSVAQKAPIDRGNRR